MNATEKQWIDNCEKIGAAINERDRLRAEITDLTADRDSWRDQNEQRVNDVLRLGAINTELLSALDGLLKLSNPSCTGAWEVARIAYANATRIKS